MKSRFLELLAKKKLHNATLNDIAELNLLCKEYEIDLNTFDYTDTLLDIKFSPKHFSNQQETQVSWQSFKEKAASIESRTRVDNETKQKIKRRTRFYYKMAASIIISFGIGYLFFNNSFKESGKLNIISTEYGSKSQVRMPDGTRVWLNSGSKITYNNQYGLKTRTVTLVGEAFFDVKHDTSHPFIIHTKNLNLKVLGTAFNVRAYDNELLSEATLIRGSLEVSFPNRSDEKIILKPQEKVCYNEISNNTIRTTQTKKIEARPKIIIAEVDYSLHDKVIEEIAWKENRLIFRSKKFKDIGLDLQRWYDVSISIENDSLRDKKFTGFFKNESVFEALDALKKTYPFSYRYDKNTNSIFIN